jgi:hypothetical protein
MFDFPQHSVEKSSLPTDAVIAYSRASHSFHATPQEVAHVEGIDKSFWRHAPPFPPCGWPVDHGRERMQ